MSALRVAPGRYIDPYTRDEFVPRPLPASGSGPVEVVRPATGAPVERKPTLGMLTADEIHERHVRGGQKVAAIHKARREGRA